MTSLEPADAAFDAPLVHGWHPWCNARWQTARTRVTAMEQPKTIHDFYGFPPELHAKRYPAPGSPELARLTVETLKDSHVRADSEWGLDHGAWAVLCQMYPKADVPVVQLSLDQRQPPAVHYELGRELRGLRKQGVLILGSGNIVHNLREVLWEDTAYDWALEFDAKVKDLILSGDHKAIIDYSKLGRSARLSCTHAGPLPAAPVRPRSAGRGRRRELLCRQGNAGVDVDAGRQTWISTEAFDGVHFIALWLLLSLVALLIQALPEHEQRWNVAGCRGPNARGEFI